MDDYEEEENRPRRWWLFLVIPLAIVALVAGGIWAGKTFFSDSNDETSSYQRAMEAAMAGRRIGYATEVVTSDPVTLQQQVDAMVERSQQPGLALEYKDTAFSTDGKNFECYIGNSADNIYDMFFTLYKDPEMTEILFLSELLRPGSRFEKITLEETLEPGTYDVYLVHTEVKDNEQDPEALQVIHAQLATTYHLIVQ